MNSPSQATEQRAGALFEANQRRVWQRTDRMFVVLMLVQWVAGIMGALLLSPRTWEGATSSTHPHVWAAVFLGGAVTSLPVVCTWQWPGWSGTRQAVAVGQMLMSGLLIHLSGGHAETHFHVFGSLAFLAFYRDWRIILSATIITTADHFLRGSYWPDSIFGFANANSWRWLEHASWVVFEDVFLLISIHHSLGDTARDAHRAAELEGLKNDFERQVAERTEALTDEIAGRKETEDRLRLRDSALKAAANAIAIVDRRGCIIWINPAFTRLTGYTAFEILGENPRILKSGEHGPDFYKALWETITAGEVWQGELINRRKDGTHYAEEMSITPMRDATGAITHFVAIKQDITARRQAELELAATRDAALAAVRSKSQFLANMSHEIRTPMNGVIGMAGLLLETTLDREQREYVDAIRHSSDLLLSIINDILDFSKIDAGKLDFEVHDFDPREVVESTLELLAEKARAQGLELLGQVDADVDPALCGDAGRLRQILTNLLSNAIKFTERGEVFLHLTVERAPDSPATAEAPEVCLRFEVRDTGIGISAEAQRRLFQPFQQADNSTTRKYGGTGLGLAISRELVGLMHGQIGIISEPGQGSTFWFTARFARPTTPAPRRPEPADLAGVRVLIVDDNATNRKILSTQLASLRIRCAAAGSGREALDRLQRAHAGGDPFDLAILDLQMPEMDGLMLGAAIKANPVLTPVRLVMLSSIGHRLDRPTLQAGGIEEYLLKPAKQSRLYDCLATVMSGHAKPAAAPSLARSRMPDAPRHAERVLLAEDNRINQTIALKQLRRLGYRADVAADGHEVMSALQRHPYDLIFMDCQMPALDGYETTARIRQEYTRPIHIIAMTAHAMQGDREKCLAAGMDDYIPKPVDPSNLEAALDRWRARGRPMPASAPPQTEFGEAPRMPPIDPAVIAGLRDLSSEEDGNLFEELIAIFRHDAPAAFGKIARALEQGDARIVTHLAHSIKGNSGAFGARALASLCREMETASGAGELRRVSELLPRAEEALQKVLAALQAELELQPA